jgi:hypothetical protein
MNFSSHDMIVSSPCGPIHARMTSGALYCLWSADHGPQDAAGLVAANREEIAALSLDKFEAARFEEDGFILITEHDIANETKQATQVRQETKPYLASVSQTWWARSRTPPSDSG